MSVNIQSSYTDDVKQFSGSKDLSDLIGIAFQSAFEHINTSASFTPMAMVMKQGKLNIMAIEDHTSRSTEEVARALLEPQAAEVEMYAVSYVAFTQTPSGRLPLLVVMAAERGAAHGYRAGWAFSVDAPGQLERAASARLMGKVEQFLG